MSQAHYERIQNQLELYKKLTEAEVLDASGEKGTSHENVMKKLKSCCGVVE